MTQKNVIIIPTPLSVILAQRIAAQRGTTRAEIAEFADALMADAKEASYRIIENSKTLKGIHNG
jgi:UDP-N-acetyl-D-mannosaminuronic acid transferase (WecB/TagA/CpsF family)